MQIPFLSKMSQILSITHSKWKSAPPALKIAIAFILLSGSIFIAIKYSDYVETEIQSFNKKALATSSVDKKVSDVSVKDIEDKLDKAKYIRLSSTDASALGYSTTNLSLVYTDNKAEIWLDDSVELKMLRYANPKWQEDPRWKQKLSLIAKQSSTTEMPTTLRLMSGFKNALGVLMLIPLACFLAYGLWNLDKLAEKSSNPRKANAMDSEKIEGSMNDIIGMDDIKKEIRQLVHYIQNKSEYEKHGINRPFNIMFSGPAGTGKSKLASYLAKEIGYPFFYAAGSSLETGLVGGGSGVLLDLYNKACEGKKAVIFLDEAQSLFMKRGQGREKWSDETANTFLSILDGVKTKKDAEIIWIVASNFNESNMEMDEAMLRRFEMKIAFRLPNLKERIAILKHYLSKKDSSLLAKDIDYSSLGHLTANLAPAKLESICKKASFLAIDQKSIIDNETLYKAFETSTIGLTSKASNQAQEKTRKIVAIHETGHFLMDYLPRVLKTLGTIQSTNTQTLKECHKELLATMPTLKISTESVASVGALGFVLNKDNEVGTLQTKQDLEHQIMCLYGGVAAEELFLGKDGITTGSANDIEKVSKILDAMVNKLNMYGTDKINWSCIQATNSMQTEKMKEVADALYTKTIKLLEEHKDLVAYLSNRIMEEYVLSLDQILDEIHSYTISKNQNVVSLSAAKQISQF